jgi:poly(3-hydroxybutyrate) depolymerase
MVELVTVEFDPLNPSANMYKLVYSAFISAALLLGGCGGGGHLDEVELQTLAFKQPCKAGGAKRCVEPTPEPELSPAPAPAPEPEPAPTPAAYPIGSSLTSVTLDNVAFDVYTYKPTGTIKGILLVFHGMNRNAADYRNYAKPLADKAGFVVAAPLFDQERFTNQMYNRGNVIPGTTPDTWTTRFTPLLISAVKASEGNLPVYIFGYSAGGQHVARVAAFETLPDVVRIVSGGSSVYVLPKLGKYPDGEAAPYGMGMVYNPGEAELTRYLMKPYSIIVGSEDSDPNATNLATSDAAMRQGIHRLDRAQKTFALAQTVAAERSDLLRWDLYVVPGVGHNASAILRSKELQQAMRLPSPAPL